MTIASMDSRPTDPHKGRCDECDSITTVTTTLRHTIQIFDNGDELERYDCETLCADCRRERLVGAVA